MFIIVLPFFSLGAHAHMIEARHPQCFNPSWSHQRVGFFLPTKTEWNVHPWSWPPLLATEAEAEQLKTQLKRRRLTKEQGFHGTLQRFCCCKGHPNYIVGSFNPFWTILVQLDRFFPGRDEHEKRIWNHHLVKNFTAYLFFFATSLDSAASVEVLTWTHGWPMCVSFRALLERDSTWRFFSSLRKLQANQNLWKVYPKAFTQTFSNCRIHLSN